MGPPRVTRARVASAGMLASVATFAIEGVGSREVTVEVDVRAGLPVLTLVGLPDRAVRESRERVRAALLNSGLEFPMKRLTVNLAPAHVQKTGPSFDLGIAVALLAASDQIPAAALRACAVFGELSLSGGLRPCRGALGASLGARTAGYRRLIVPPENAAEAALVDTIEVLAAPDLTRIAELFRGRWTPDPARPHATGTESGSLPDLADVRGQEDAKRALEIAAAGGHNLLMIGPPGAGKTMLARRLPGILPPPTFEEALEITQVRSVAGLGDGSLASDRPFRSPHHTISPQGLVGGGSTPRAGEITLAHRGVLFLDELTEFGRPALDALRQPLEEGRVEITRGQRWLEFPASFMLVAACNPCPCGAASGSCSCDAGALARYARRLSGPLLDRVDLVCQVGALPAEELARPGSGTASAGVRERVVAARASQGERLRGLAASCNGELDAAATRERLRLRVGTRRTLVRGAVRAALSGRGYDRVLRVARTIADLDGRKSVMARDLEEALGYRLAPTASAAA
ncbi:MAG: YifB family Mg chelatase-like AAA ATPase [Thermoleophilaceae bacterium]